MLTQSEQNVAKLQRAIILCKILRRESLSDSLRSEIFFMLSTAQNFAGDTVGAQESALAFQQFSASAARS
jgi:hypothetical protein